MGTRTLCRGAVWKSRRGRALLVCAGEGDPHPHTLSFVHKLFYLPKGRLGSGRQDRFPTFMHHKLGVEVGGGSGSQLGQVPLGTLQACMLGRWAVVAASSRR